MLPGKRYTVDDLLHILRRRYWLIVVPFALVGAAAAAYTRSLPDVYFAETVIMVVPQRIPENYVQSTVTAKIEDRLQSLRTTLLSRTRLERIIQQFDLYPDERRSGPMEDVVELMRRNVSVANGSGNSFRVGYHGSDPVKVMKVADSLASLFINESLLDRQTQAEGTNQFLDSELAEALSKLREQERRLAVWKQTHAGELPNQVDANLALMQNTSMELRGLRDSMGQDRARRLELERQLGDLQDPGRVRAATDAGDVGTSATQLPAAASSTEQQLAAAEAQVEAYEQRGLRAGHPDLDAARRRVRDLQARLEREASTVSVGPRTTLSAAELARLRRIEDLKNEIATIDKQLARNLEQEKRLMATAADVQRRIDAMPARETEETELQRDYGTLRATYENLLRNKQQAAIAANLERRQVGEQFKLMDPAQLPVRPVSPNRPRDIGLGLGIGLLVGLAIVGFLEYRDRSFKLDEDVAGLLQLPVLAVVPVMKSDSDVRRAFWASVTTTIGLGSIVAASLMFVAYAFMSS